MRKSLIFVPMLIFMPPNLILSSLYKLYIPLYKK
nr:MAG TPA: hypothetical protein [Caudoviricetes sp.]